MSKELTTSNTVFFSTANAGYAIFAATSLLTIRDVLPEAKLWILSSGLSAYDKKILTKHKISYFETDLRDRFTQTWDYPIDCYYLFAGPEYLYKQGFEYSVYVDGDVLCDGDPLRGVGEIRGIAGVASKGYWGKYTSIFGDDWEEIKKIWELPEKAATAKRINSGVVYFNNKRMKKIGLLEKGTKLFATCLQNDIPRKGDDSLFSLLQYVYIKESDRRFLPAGHNFVLQFFNWEYPVKDLKFFHFSIDKPWKKNPFQHDQQELNMFNPYVKKWRKKFRQVAPKSWFLNSLQLKRK